MMKDNNLFYGGDIESSKKTQNKGFYWTTTRLLRESGPWYAETVKCPADVVQIMHDHLDLENCDREHFIVIYLDRKGGTNAICIVSVGGLNSSIVHPREVFKTALLTSSASIILVHNHPSGDPAPSIEDKDVTKRLVDAGRIMGIDVLDHIIIGVGKYCSLKEKGLM